MKIKTTTLYKEKKRKTFYEVQIWHEWTINNMNKYQQDYMMRSREKKKTSEKMWTTWQHSTRTIKKIVQ